MLKTKDSTYKILLAFLGLISSIGWFFLKGAEPILSNDSYFYISYADDLMKMGFEFYKTTDCPPYYWLFPHVLSIFKSISSQHFPDLIFLLNSVCWAFCVLSMYLILNQLNIRKSIQIIGSVYFALLPECFQWNQYVLSDTIFMLLHILLSYLTLLLLNGSKKNKVYLFYSAVSLILLYSRPVAFVAVMISFSFLFLYYVLNKQFFLFLKLIIPVVLIFSSSLILFKTTEKTSKKMEDYTASGYANTFTNWFEEGMIIHDRPTYNIETMKEQDHVAVYYLKVFVLRFVHFWHPFLKEYSTFHLLVNAITLLPIFILGWIEIILQLKSLIKNKFKSLLTPHVYLIAILLAYTGFHSLTLIDFDHRYRYPHLFISVIFSCLFISRFFKNTKFAHNE